MKWLMVAALIAPTLAWWEAAEAQTVAEVFKQVSSSVVVVGTVAKDVVLEAEEPRTRAVPGQGSGVLVSSDGKVVTAAHVVQTVDRIRVQSVAGEVVGARVIASGPEGDVALPAGGLVYATYVGGTGDDVGRGIAVNTAGHVYLTGETTSSDSPTVRALQSARAGASSDAFVAKLEPTGTALVYSTYLGGSDLSAGGDRGVAIAVDGARSASVAGRTGSPEPSLERSARPAGGRRGLSASRSRSSTSGFSAASSARARRSTRSSCACWCRRRRSRPFGALPLWS